MLSVDHRRENEYCNMEHVRHKPSSPCSQPPVGPEPLLMSRQEVDELYNLLSALLAALNELEIPHLVIAESLLGAVRSQSVLFNDDKVDIAIIEEDEDGVNYQLLIECLPFMLSNAAEERCTSNRSKQRIQYTYHQRPCLACDRIKSSVAPRVWINLFVLKKYQTEHELMNIVETADDHQQQVVHNNNSSANDANSIINTMGRDTSFPLYHYDNRKAIELWPREYFYPHELLPLKSLNFGPLQVSGPHCDVSTLRRFYGKDCFTHYARITDNSSSLLSEEDRPASPPWDEESTEKIPLTEEQYLPVQHSQHDKRIWSQHCRQALQLYIANQEQQQQQAADDNRNKDVPFSVVNVTDCSQSLEISPILDSEFNFGISAPPRLDPLQSSSPGHHHHGPPTTISKGNNNALGMKGGLSRKKSVFSLTSESVSSSGSTVSSTVFIEEPQPTKGFGHDVRQQMMADSLLGDAVPQFNKELRQVMEPYIREATKKRGESRNERLEHVLADKSIASANVGVPYTSLRTERPFLFDNHTYPIHQVLAETIGVEDLSKLHENEIQDIRFLLAPLFDRKRRRAFHECYDNFVTSFCIPLLHSVAMTKNIFHTTSPTASTKIVYRYQAFPCIRIVRPGEFSIGPHCDTAYGHCIGGLKFHVPLTPAYGTNALYTESHPGREDWHPLSTKALGLGYVFDGARCLHYSLENTTEQTRVSLDFRIAIYREDHSNSDVDGGLCTREMLEDQYSKAGPGYYDEAIIDIGIQHNTFAGPVIVKKFGHRLLDPDKRNGFPFTK